MKFNKFDVQLNSANNSAWARAMEALPDICRIANSELEYINDNDKSLIIGVFCLMTAELFKKQWEAEKLEDQFESRNWGEIMENEIAEAILEVQTQISRLGLTISLSTLAIVICLAGLIWKKWNWAAHKPSAKGQNSPAVWQGLPPAWKDNGMSKQTKIHVVGNGGHDINYTRCGRVAKYVICVGGFVFDKLQKKYKCLCCEQAVRNDKWVFSCDI